MGSGLTRKPLTFPQMLVDKEGKNAEFSVHTWEPGHRYLQDMLASLSKRNRNEGVMTLVIHLVWGTIWRCWVARVLKMIVAAISLELLNVARWSLVLAWDLSTGLVTNGWELDRSTWLLVASRRIVGRVLTISWDDGGSCTLVIGLALVLLLLLAGLPFFADFLELC